MTGCTAAAIGNTSANGAAAGQHSCRLHLKDLLPYTSFPARATNVSRFTVALGPPAGGHATGTARSVSSQ